MFISKTYIYILFDGLHKHTAKNKNKILSIVHFTTENMNFVQVTCLPMMVAFVLCACRHGSVIISWDRLK